MLLQQQTTHGQEENVFSPLSTARVVPQKKKLISTNRLQKKAESTNHLGINAGLQLRM